MVFNTKYLANVLWVSLLVLITYSCSSSKRTFSSKKSVESYTKEEVAKANGTAELSKDTTMVVASKESAIVVEKVQEVDAPLDYMELERVWAKDCEFSDKERVTVGFSSYDFFSENESIRIDLDSLSAVATFPFNGVFSSNYGFRGSRMHRGVDLSARNGAKDIHAFLGGVVRMSTYMKGFGNTIVLRHYNGLETVYAHNKRNKVKRGDVVRSGDVIAIVGHTGRSTGAHLHFEVRVNGVAIDPNFFIDPKKLELKSGEMFIHRFNKTTILASNIEDKSKVIVKKYHTIRSGDTLSHISRRYRIPVTEICKMNRISTRTILKIGRQLRVA